MFSDWKKKLIPNNNNDSANQYPQKLNIKNRTNIPTINQNQHQNQQPQPQYKTEPSPNIPKKVMKWGEPTWTLFHTLAQKIDENEFSRVRLELFDLINTICHTLPCPDCASHAGQYISKVNWTLINNKQKLIDLMWQFHNDVNRRKGYPLFNHDLLEKTYGGKNVIEVVRIFMYHYEDKYSKGPNSAIAAKFHRQRIAFRLKTWFNENVKYFSLQIPPLSS